MCKYILHKQSIKQILYLTTQICAISMSLLSLAHAQLISLNSSLLNIQQKFKYMYWANNNICKFALVLAGVKLYWNYTIARVLPSWLTWCLVSCIQWKLSITRSLGPRNFVCYIRYFVISVVNKQYKTKEINSLGLEKLVCYIRYFVISNLFIWSSHRTTK